MLFLFYHCQELLQLFNSGEQHVLEERHCQLIGYRQFVGTLDHLVEVAAHPCQVLLIFFVEGHHFVKRGNFTFRANIVKLLDSIPNHAADRLVVDGFLLNQFGILC